MLEEIIKKLIDDLGATGVFLVGLWYIVYQSSSKIEKSISQINSKLNKITDILQTYKPFTNKHNTNG